ncbi:MAG: hypothetical protein WC254_01495 [Candidatus Woesearchaeota archaeon]|jgi:hypothetical protein
MVILRTTLKDAFRIDPIRTTGVLLLGFLTAGTLGYSLASFVGGSKETSVDNVAQKCLVAETKYLARDITDSITLTEGSCLINNPDPATQSIGIIYGLPNNQYAYGYVTTNSSYYADISNLL